MGACSSGTVLKSRRDVLDVLSVLQVCEAYLLTVDTYARASTYDGKPSDTQHYITVGRTLSAGDAAGEASGLPAEDRSPSFYLYDSEPNHGSQLMRLPERPTGDALWACFERAPRSVPGAAVNFKGAGVVSAVAPADGQEKAS